MIILEIWPLVAYFWEPKINIDSVITVQMQLVLYRLVIFIYCIQVVVAVVVVVVVVAIVLHGNECNCNW